VEYTLTEEALVKFTVTGADGVAKEEIIPGITGVNYYVFTEAKPQTYTVTAVPTDKAGNVGDPTGQTIQAIRVNAPPVVGLPGEIKATIGRTLTFKADVTDPDGVEGDSFSYEWLPGDGGPFLTGGTPEYIYNSLGEYTLVLKVTDKDGGWAMVTATVKVGNTADGELCVDETWSGSHRIYGDVIVPSGIKLTILPGTEIIIDGVPGETGYDHALIVRGTLNAGAGTKFTSVTGTAGGWKGILVEGEANLEEGAISYAERGVAALDGAKVSLEGCVFEYNLAGVHAYNCNPEIGSCVFKNNVYGIKEDESGRPVTKDCRFSGNGVDYYHRELTEISMEQLNGMPGNEGNVKE
jgi:PKD repeat protein